MTTAPRAPAARRAVLAALARVPTGLAVAAAVALALYLVYRPGHVNYDARYTLLWARDLTDGFLPDYTTPFTPTPHPLQTLVSLLLLPFGGAADDAMIALALLSLGGLVWIAYRLGAELYSPWVGVVAAAVVLTRPALERYAMIGYQDLAFALIVLASLLAELRSPRRGLPVLAALAVGGLIRPEGWVLAGLYALWLWPAASPRRRAALAALAAAAPALWLAQDWIVTGDPLHSLHGTTTLAEQKDRTEEPARIPIELAKSYRFLLRPPLAIGVPIGIGLALLYARRRSLAPLGVVALLTAVAAFFALVGLPIIHRYVITPAVVLAVFYGLAVFGWRLVPEGTARRVAQGLAVVALGASLAWIPAHADQLAVLDEHIDVNRGLYDDIRLVGEAPAVRERFEACGTITSVGHRPIPDLRWWIDGPPRSVEVAEGRLTRVGPVLMLPRAVPQMFPFYRDVLARVKPPPGYRPLYENDSWRVYARPDCRDGRLAAPPGGAGD